jgi:hypothetical protein
METHGFAWAAKKFFGLKPGQTLREFGDELKPLTAADRKELAALMGEELGCIVTV